MQAYSAIDLCGEIRRLAIQSKESSLEASRRVFRDQIIRNGFVETSNGFHIKISHTPCRFGGFQAWFTCSSCNRSCRKLYLKDSSLACRVCLEIPYTLRNLPKSGGGKISRALHFIKKAESLADSSLRFGNIRKKRFEKYNNIASGILERHYSRIKSAI